MKKISILCIVAAILLLTVIVVACVQAWRNADTTPTTTTTASSTTAPSADSTSADTTSADTTGSQSGTDGTTEGSPDTDGTLPESTAPEETLPKPEPLRYVTVSLSGTDVYTGSLILVDSQSPYCYKVASLYTPAELDRLSASELAELGWVSLYANKNGNFLLRSRLLFMKTEVYSAFVQMMSDYVARTGNRDVQVRYAYQLINASTDAASLSDERATGLVVEINIFNEEGTFSIDHSSKKAAYYDWFATNCHKYGFVMTGESGYFRYVGSPHATYMQENRLSLSEYLVRLSSYTFDSPLAVTDHNGVLWNIYSVKASAGSLTDVRIRENSVYVISGNNRDGFIVASRDMT